MEACLDALPHLQYGLQVNCLFRKQLPMFERSPGFLVFDMLGIKVLHGWVPDTHDPVALSVLENLSYNDAMTLLVQADDAGYGPPSLLDSPPPSTTPAATAAMAAQQSPVNPFLDAAPKTRNPFDELLENNNNSSSSSTVQPPPLESQPSKGKGELDGPSSFDDSKGKGDLSPIKSGGPAPSAAALELRDKAATVRAFLDSTPSQLSMEGIFHLTEVLKVGELAVLFRNNHFSTVTIGPGGTPYSLITDVGFMHDFARVWETISLTGDVEYVDAQFRLASPPAAVSVPGDLGMDRLPFELGETDEELVRREQAAADAAFARRLQAEEDSGRVRPVGRLVHVGYDVHGRELLEDEVGQRFHRPRQDGANMLGFRRGGREQAPPEGGEVGSQGGEDKKCLVC